MFKECCPRVEHFERIPDTRSRRSHRRALLEDVIKPHQLEERIYRHRCVEAWSMVIPWVGVPLSAVLHRAKPRASATR